MHGLDGIFFIELEGKQRKNEVQLIEKVLNSRSELTGCWPIGINVQSLIGLAPSDGEQT